MNISTVDTQRSRVMTWTGWIISAGVFVFLLADAAIELLAPNLVRQEIENGGFRFEDASRLGWIVLLCAIVYAVPQTAVLGAILVTGFFGGAICAHFRLGELGSPPQLVALLVAVLAWSGLYLRDHRLRALLPLRSISVPTGRY